MKFDSMDIVKAMQIIAESNNSKLRLDKTIIARIISVENLETGEYRVAYEGNNFLAYSYNVKVSFAVNDNVYVKIPENDMTNRKIIEGKVSSSADRLTDIIEQQVEINTIEPSLDSFYGYGANETYGIVAGVGSEHSYFARTIYESQGTNLGDNLFQTYAANYNKIKISGSFFTRFIGTHHKGNYGLIVTFKTLNFDDEGDEQPGTISYRLDFSNFVGDPYRYTSPSPQSIVIDVAKDSVIGLDSIVFFQENFEFDKSLNYDNQTIYENIGEDEPPICNIFVQDIDIAFCEVIDLKETSYYLTIGTPQGIVFSGDATSLTLDARLKYKGSNILSSTTCKTYWYKENLEVKKGDEKYDKLAGVRWENINPIETDFLSSITVGFQDVKVHARYKLVVIYQDVVLSKEIELKQLGADHDLEIRQTTHNNSRIVLQVVSNIEDDNRDYVADWYFFLPDGSYDLIPDGQKKSEIDVTDYLIYPTATFYCQTYYEDEPISIEVHNFAISDSQDDLIITYIGEDVFQYDANGDIAYEATETDRTLGIKVEWRDGFGSMYTVSYLAPDGKELGTDRTKAHTAANSMIESLWVDSASILHYNIRQKYNINYNNNIITVKIKCATNGNEYLFRKELLFLKDGDQGTNGTTYVCAIRPVNLANGNKLNGFHALEYDGGWQGDGLNLRCYVYKNGDLVNGSSNFELTFNWECGSKNDKTDKLSINVIPGFTNLSDYRRVQGIGTLDTKGDYVIKMTLTVREVNNSERVEIHCQYPIDIAVGGFRMNLLDMNLPSYVKYTASGINASFLNQELKCTYGGNTLPIYSTDESIIQIRNSKLSPAQKFQYTGGIAALRCEVSSTVYLLHPVMMYLDTYGNEAINGWDGTRLELDDDGKYILAPQIGAGRKEDDNTFTGVVMGKDTAEDKIGLYGYSHGIAHFGFKEDGTAFIGASGEGQILFNGNKGTITSGNYGDTTGMKIDLQNGHIDSYNFKLSSGNMLLDSANQRFDFTVGDSSNSRFQITHKDGVRLFYAADDNYYLQSKDYQANTQGTKFDLANGRIDSYNFKLHTSSIDLDSANNRFVFQIDKDKSTSYFQIKSTTTEGNKILFNASANNYYLQSMNYAYQTQDSDGNVIPGKGMRINLDDGAINSYDFNLRSSCLTINSATNRFAFDVSAGEQNGAFTIRAGNIALMNVSKGSYYLRSSNYNSKTGDELEGVYIDLQNGTFKVGGGAEFRGTIRAQNILLRSSTGTGYNSVLTNNGSSFSGTYINCRGLSVYGTNGSYFVVDSNGNVRIKGTIVLDSSSTITWNQISDGNSVLSPLQNAITNINNDIYWLEQDMSNLSYNTQVSLGYVDNFVKKFGYTSISAIGINAPVINAGWITAGKIDAERIGSVKILQTDMGLSIRDNAIVYDGHASIDFRGDSINFGGMGSLNFYSYVYFSRGIYIGNLSLDDYIRNIARTVVSS